MEPRPVKYNIVSNRMHICYCEGHSIIYSCVCVCAGVPEPPATVTLHVTSNRSLTVSFTEPQESNGAVVTRYKSECMIQFISQFPTI